ncbi:MAG TPA: hypothetical protein VFX84_02980 [Candidatus Saccharimonadales bacterium]|nr:hypothetical protein [Candidatus Saccharimonadales bacterium]
MSEVALATAEPATVPNEPAVVDGGRVAVSRHLALVEPEAYSSGLVGEEISVLSHISQGNTLGQVAEELGVGKDEVIYWRGNAMSKYRSGSVTATVNEALRDGSIPVEVSPDPETAARLTPLDKRVLELYAKGVTNHDLAGQIGKPVKVVERYHDGLLERIGAWKRPHAMRRMYELGIWQTDQSH